MGQRLWRIVHVDSGAPALELTANPSHVHDFKRNIAATRLAGGRIPDSYRIETVDRETGAVVDSETWLVPEEARRPPERRREWRVRRPDGGLIVICHNTRELMDAKIRMEAVFRAAALHAETSRGADVPDAHCLVELIEIVDGAETILSSERWENPAAHGADAVEHRDDVVDGVDRTPRSRDRRAARGRRA
jgi:hypothetical protein